MKRLIYISKASQDLSAQEIENIGLVAQEKNAQSDITGFLVYMKGLFYQILEGDEERTDALFKKIGADPRHTDVMCLKTENRITHRHFPNWSMKTINLDTVTDDIMLPVKMLLQTLVESHSIIREYTQPSVMKIINSGINPLSVQPERSEKIILFGDIISYSTLSETLEMTDVLLIINTYFEICSRIISKRNGEINKFIGDGVMAYFDSDCADMAIGACLDILRELDDLRREVPENSPLQLLYSGFGLAKGVVIEGNMGSSYKMDYTIVGDAVNIAARLESLTRTLQRPVIISDSVKNRSRGTWRFHRVGEYYLKGKQNVSVVYAVEHSCTHHFVGKEELLHRINGLHTTPK
jgi:class 3 adenylate cyclase